MCFVLFLFLKTKLCLIGPTELPCLIAMGDVSCGIKRAANSRHRDEVWGGTRDRPHWGKRITVLHCFNTETQREHSFWGPSKINLRINGPCKTTCYYFCFEISAKSLKNDEFFKKRLLKIIQNTLHKCFIKTLRK